MKSDFNADKPIYIQVREQIEDQILNKQMRKSLLILKMLKEVKNNEYKSNKPSS